MEKKVSFRFDVDTINCIKNGIPKLVDISKKYNIEFSFFMNFGRSIDRREVFKRKNTSNLLPNHKISTISKLGLINFLITLLINPRLSSYRNSIEYMAKSNNEIVLHGGFNHGTWQVKGASFDLIRLEKEIDFGMKNGKKFNLDFSGFTSPGWTSNKLISDLLIINNFYYISDTYTSNNKNKEIKKQYTSEA